MVETNTRQQPTFCGVCGSRLFADENVSGFDVYSGEPNLETTLRCNNPTVVTSGVTRRRQTTYHARWEKNTDGNWVQL